MSTSLLIPKVNTLNVYWLETKFEWLKTVRNPAFALPTLLFPTMFYLFFGVLLNQGNVPASTYLLCTYATFGVMGPALFSFGAGLAVERSRGWLDVKEASPMPAFAQVVSRILVSMLFSLIIVSVMMLIAVFVAGVNLSLDQGLLLLFVLILGSLPFCLLGLVLGLSLKAESAAAVVNAIYLPMSFLSGLWLPISMLPGFLQSFAQFLPSYHLAQLTLKVIGQDLGGAIVVHITALLIFSVAFLLLALKLYAKARS
ncbi:ABC transporter permease [Agaribacterium sp. ZY112]|uniref:ABC transporter permease n=1 Tax=Agaribacterium sp. ZY112 TaxID=3233574 RepID=UPI00352367C5